MRESRLDIDIRLPLHKQPGGKAIDQNTGAGHPHHQITLHRLVRRKALNRLPDNAADRHHQQDGIEQSRHDRCAAKAISKAGDRLLLRQPPSRP